MEAHPVIERYLGRFETAFNEFEIAEREEIMLELRNHIAEARAAGTPLDTVLATLGSADLLARAYAVELALHPREAVGPEAREGLLAAIAAAGARRVRAVGAALPKAFPAARAPELARRLYGWVGECQTAPLASHASGHR